jgi:hypothetical protein
MVLDQTILNPLGIALTLSMGVLLLILPRRFALLPIAVITCYMTFGQRVVVAGLHFTMLRVLVLFGCARIALRTEFRALKWTRIDTLVVLWVLANVMVYVLLRQTLEALIYRLGFAYDALGLYFLFRVLVQNIEDVKRACRLFAVLIFPLAICMCIEKVTGRDLFYVFGGVGQFTGIREGVLRCMGPFRHPILAGTFGAVWVPLFVGLWWQGKGNRFLALLGILSGTVITILAGSSGPLGTYLAGIVGIGMWTMRNHVRLIRRGIVALLVALEIAMKGHVWYIFGYISDLGLGFKGATGWHRSVVLDVAIRHFSTWWLLGTTDADMAHFGVFAGDLTNQYVVEAQQGGLLTLILFICVIVIAFSIVGTAMRAVRLESRCSHLLLWAVGSALFAHVITFLGVPYFDQNIVNWYLVLAFASVAATQYCRRAERPIPAERRQQGSVRSLLGALEKT